MLTTTLCAAERSVRLRYAGARRRRPCLAAVGAYCVSPAYFGAFPESHDDNFAFCSRNTVFELRK